MSHVFVAAGELSGDLLGGDLIAALRARHPDLQFTGLGGMAMQAQGIQSLFPISDLSVMGFVPVLARLPNILQRARQTLAHIEETKPDIAILIDSPDFMRFLAWRIRARHPNMPIIGYVAPQIWAWRRGRAKRLRRSFNHILALLPFEPEVFARADGPPCTFVGHPVVTRISAYEPFADFNAKYNIANDTPLLCVLPGSRASEVNRLLPLFGKIIENLTRSLPNLQICMPVVQHLNDYIQSETKTWARAPIFIHNEAEKWSAFSTCDAALAASGTVTLELAMTQTPMVAAYDLGVLTNNIIERLLQVPSVLLPNLILDKPAIKEFIGRDATAENITPAIGALLQDKEKNAAMRATLAPIRPMLLPQKRSPAESAAEVVLSYL